MEDRIFIAEVHFNLGNTLYMNNFIGVLQKKFFYPVKIEISTVQMAAKLKFLREDFMDDFLKEADRFGLPYEIEIEEAA